LSGFFPLKTHISGAFPAGGTAACKSALLLGRQAQPPLSHSAPAIPQTHQNGQILARFSPFDSPLRLLFVVVFFASPSVTGQSGSGLGPLYQMVFKKNNNIW